MSKSGAKIFNGVKGVDLSVSNDPMSESESKLFLRLVVSAVLNSPFPESHDVIVFLWEGEGSSSTCKGS